MWGASLCTTATCKFSLFLLVLSLHNLSITAVPFILVLSDNDIQVPTTADDTAQPDYSPDWEGFRDSGHKSEDELDPGSWRPIFEHDSAATTTSKWGTNSEVLYYSGVGKMMTSISSGDVKLMEEASRDIKAAAESGCPAAQSVVGFLYGMGHLMETNKGKAFLYHHFAAEGGNMKSKMALANMYMCQEVSNFTTLQVFPWILNFYELLCYIQIVDEKCKTTWGQYKNLVFVLLR